MFCVVAPQITDVELADDIVLMDSFKKLLAQNQCHGCPKLDEHVRAIFDCVGPGWNKPSCLLCCDSFGRLPGHTDGWSCCRCCVWPSVCSSILCATRRCVHRSLHASLTQSLFAHPCPVSCPLTQYKVMHDHAQLQERVRYIAAMLTGSWILCLGPSVCATVCVCRAV